ncbi:MAG: c-type cytochrome [Planctomycetaceae bacterium]|nr:c-type cytochrome [Planctomycetaceae bacterium]
MKTSPPGTRLFRPFSATSVPAVAGAMAILCGLLLAAAVSRGLAEEKPAAAKDDAAKTVWHLVPIPDSWKRQPGGDLATKDGYAWYRCLVKIPAEWEDEKLELLVEPVDDARQAYVNGVQVGASGTFPPQYRSGLGEKGRYRVPEEAVRFGEYNTIAVRTFNSDGRSNFSVAAPTLFIGKSAIRMEGQWQYSPGDDKEWATTQLKETPKPSPEMPAVYATIDEVDNLERYLLRRQGDHDPYPPAEALKTFQVAEDLRIEQPLADPVIGQPLFINWDERGRLWVLEYLQYPNPAGLKMLSRDQHLRTVYDKVPQAPPNHVRGADRITIHEDTNNDGIYDAHKTYIDGLNIASCFVKGRGGVFVLNPPYMLFYPDADNDDVPDGDPEVLLEGFGIEDSHSVVNSLRWGPDGWLYAGQGSTVSGNVKRPGQKAEEAHRSMGQQVWRYHPETKRYEVFAEGGGNTFGVEIDSKGRVYSGTNGGNSRGFHYVQGGYFRKGFGKHGALSNPYAFGYFEDMEHPPVPRFTHNFIIYEGDALPEQYNGRLFGIEPLQGQVVQSKVFPNQTTFRTEDIDRPVQTEDQWFRPVDIKVGPDGGIYIADMYEQRIDHSSHFAGRIDKESGRIYRIIGAKEPRQPKFDYRKATGEDLVALLSHPNRWHRQKALQLIADRRDVALAAPLNEILNKQTGQLALEAVWALNLTGGLTVERAIELLEHEEPYVRLWTARLMCDRVEADAEFSAAMAKLAEREPYDFVRSQLASSARRLPASQAMPVIEALLKHDADVDQMHIPLLLWWAVEAKATEDPAAVLAMLSDRELWSRPIVANTIIERLMRRWALAGTRKDLIQCAKLLKLAPDKASIDKLMAGFEEAFKGRSLAVLPEELVNAITDAGGGSPALKLRQGKPEAVAHALQEVVQPATPAATRLEYLTILGEIRIAEAVPALLQVLRESDNEGLQKAALTALQAQKDPKIADQIISIHPGLKPEVREVAQTLLSGRREWARAFLQAVAAGTIEKESVTDAIVRKLLLHGDPKIEELVSSQFGEVQGATTEDMRKEIERLTALLQMGSGNPYDGRELFMKNCGKCHLLFGQGGKIGPDLTTFKRDDLGRMLLNVVNPSAEIREGFENYLVLTEDGRVVNGFLADQDSRVVVVRGVDGQNIIVSRDEIEEMRAIPRSVMPDGALKTMNDQQLRDLFAYLRMTQPLP